MKNRKTVEGPKNTDELYCRYGGHDTIEKTCRIKQENILSNKYDGNKKQIKRDPDCAQSSH